jgi:hypothetical protein
LTLSPESIQRHVLLTLIPQINEYLLLMAELHLDEVVVDCC